MKHFFTSLVLIAAFISFAAVIDAQTLKPALPKSALLYEISGGRIKQPSYLFGTIHVICEQDMLVRDRLALYLNKTDQFLLEVDLDDPMAIQKAVELSTFKDGKTISDYMSAEEYARLDELYITYLGIPFEPLQKFKPMVASAMLFTSPKILGCPAPVVYDSFLARIAGVRKISIVGLETIEQQIAIIDSLPLEKQIKDLKDMSTNPQKTIDQFQKLYKLYLTQDSDALFTYTIQLFTENGYSTEKMLDQRNLNWIPVIEQRIAEKPTLIAIGAGHLGGMKGIVNLLRRKGYRLTPIKL